MGNTQIRTLGTTDTYSINSLAFTGVGVSSKNTFRLSNGNFLYVVVDRNQSATVGQGDQSNVTKIYVYERVPATNVVTLRATINPADVVDQVQGALFSNDDLAIVWNNGNQGVKWTKLKYAKLTYAGYTVSGIETAVDLSADGDDATFGFLKTKWFDVDVTDDGAVLVTYRRYVVNNGLASPYSTLGSYISIAVRNTAAAWVVSKLDQDSVSQSSFANSYKFATVAVAALGGTATARRFVWASDDRIDSLQPTSTTFRVGRGLVNTTTGVVSSLSVDLSTSSWTSGYPLTYGISATTKIWRKSSASDSYVLGHANSTGFGVVRGTWDGTTHSFQQTLTMKGWTGASQALGQDYVFAEAPIGMSYANDKLVLFPLGQDVSGNQNDPADPARNSFKVNTVIVHLDVSANATVTSGFEGKANGVSTGVFAVGCSGNRNYSVDSHEVLVQYGNAAGAMIYTVWQKVPAPGGGSAILSLSPATGATNVTAQPALAGQIDTDISIDWSMYRLEYQFAENNTFTVGLIDYIEQVGAGSAGYGKPYGDPNITFLKEVSFTDQVGVTKAFANVLPVSAGSLHGGVWYYRARLINEAGQVGNWTSTNTITIGHPPVTIPGAPGGSKYFTYGAGSVDFAWTFTDPSPTDFQTAYQIIVINEITAATVFDTGKVVSGNKFHTGTVAVGNKDALLSWQIRTWDSDDSNGVFSAKSYFYLTDPPVVTITAPTAGSTQATPRPTITFNVTTSGGRTVTDATIVVSQGGNSVWSTRIPIGAASGVSKTVRPDPGFLQDGVAYSVQVKARDSQNLQGTSGVINFTADWTPPVAPSGVTVSAASYAVEGAGYVSVQWTNATVDANFAYYLVYRRDDLINPNTGAVLVTGVPRVVFTTYQNAAAMEFRDFTAPAGNYKVNYLVHQVAYTTNAAEIESTNSTYSTVQPVSDGHWLIQMDNSGNMLSVFKLTIVTGEDYTDEHEETEFIVQGRGRVVNRGQDTGKKGQLTAQLFDGGIYTARQKKQAIESVAQTNGNLYLRNPFGDFFKVNLSQVAVSRIAGTGASEFCSVTIPYAEIE